MNARKECLCRMGYCHEIILLYHLIDRFLIPFPTNVMYSNTKIWSVDRNYRTGTFSKSHHQTRHDGFASNSLHIPQAHHADYTTTGGTSMILPLHLVVLSIHEEIMITLTHRDIGDGEVF